MWEQLSFRLIAKWSKTPSASPERAQFVDPVDFAHCGEGARFQIWHNNFPSHIMSYIVILWLFLFWTRGVVRSFNLQLLDISQSNPWVPLRTSRLMPHNVGPSVVLRCLLRYDSCEGNCPFVRWIRNRSWVAKDVFLVVFFFVKLLQQMLPVTTGIWVRCMIPVYKRYTYRWQRIF